MIWCELSPRTMSQKTQSVGEAAGIMETPNRNAEQFLPSSVTNSSPAIDKNKLCLPILLAGYKRGRGERVGIDASFCNDGGGKHSVSRATFVRIHDVAHV